MPSYQKLQCRLTAPNIIVACDGDLQRKKINTDDHLTMCNPSGGTELDKASSQVQDQSICTFSRVEQIRGCVPRENEHHGAHFRGWCTNSRANLCAGARLRGGDRIRCYTGRGLRVHSKRETRALHIFSLAVFFIKSCSTRSCGKLSNRVEHYFAGRTTTL